MSEPPAITPVRSPSPRGASTSGEDLVCAFNEMRTELVSTLYFFLGNYDDAQDAAQEAFIKCWKNLDDLPEVRNMRAWIFRVGLNAAKDLQRNAYRRKARPLAPSAPFAGNDASPVDIALEQEEQERLRKAIGDLRTEEKEVYLLRQNGGLTYEEIAELRRMPVGTVKTQMRAAIAKLRKVLQDT